MAKSSVHVKKDDQVIVISGKDKGAQGKVLMVDEKNADSTIRIRITIIF